MNRKGQGLTETFLAIGCAIVLIAVITALVLLTDTSKEFETPSLDFTEPPEQCMWRSVDGIRTYPVDNINLDEFCRTTRQANEAELYNFYNYPTVDEILERAASKHCGVGSIDGPSLHCTQGFCVDFTYENNCVVYPPLERRGDLP